MTAPEKPEPTMTDAERAFTKADEKRVRATFIQINPETGLLACLEQLVPLLAAALAAARREGMERAAEIAEKEAAIGVPFTIEGASYSATCRIVADAIRAAAKEGA